MDAAAVRSPGNQAAVGAEAQVADVGPNGRPLLKGVKGQPGHRAVSRVSDLQAEYPKPRHGTGGKKTPVAAESNRMHPLAQALRPRHQFPARRFLPDQHSARDVIRHCHQAAVGAKRQPLPQTGNVRQLLSQGATRRIPDTCGAVLAGGCQPGPVWAERDSWHPALVAGQQALFLHSAQVPQAHALGGRRRDPLTVVAEAHLFRPAGMRQQRHVLMRRHRPQPDMVFLVLGIRTS